MDEKKKNYIVNLISNDDNLDVYNDLLKLKELGFAGKNSLITYKGVLVPAGLCKDSENFIVTYSAIVSGDHALLFDQVDESLSRNEAVYFLKVCSKGLKHEGREPFLKEDIQNFLEFREKNTKMFQI